MVGGGDGGGGNGRGGGSGGDGELKPVKVVVDRDDGSGDESGG